MHERSAKSRPVHENLDTAYVNLAALIRYLQQTDFDGQVHVELDEYEADVYLNGRDAPRVRETDHATGRQEEGQAALQRLLVRASEPGGQVSVYENVRAEASSKASPPPVLIETTPEVEEDAADTSAVEADWAELVLLSGELIGTIERAALSAGVDFASLFHAVRLGMADDYSFLDPATGRFKYSNGAAELHARPSLNAYVSGISEALRRVVAKISTGSRGRSVRERVALELAVLARRRQAQLATFKFTPQLDRIAGTRVL